MLTPYPPFLGLAPLDVWWRLLTTPPARIPPAYWPRLLLGLASSLPVTLLTLPERALFALRGRDRRHRGPAPVFILGYYRSGTTHLQFLLDRDPNLYSPKWYQALTPQGYVVSWALLRLFLAPLMGNRRPQDNMAFGADVPAEDDFALCNSALASCLPGRHLVPEARDFYDRYHDLTRLTPEERERFRDALMGFLARLQRLAGPRRILLKSPSHTARVAELLELFADAEGPPPIFIHISRRPESVVRSNVAMQRDLNAMYHLQDPRSDEEIEERTVAEYLATEQKYLAERSLIPPGQLAEIRLEDLQADPLGQLRRIYSEVGLEYTPAFEQGVLDYLETTRDYQPNKHSQAPAERARELSERLAPLAEAFGHNQPAVPRQEVPRPSAETVALRRSRDRMSWAVGLLVAVAALGVWLELVGYFQVRLDRLLFPTAVAIGATIHAVSPRGSWRRGLWSLGLTLATVLTATTLTTFLLRPPGEPLSWSEAAAATWAGLTAPVMWIWWVLSPLLAYRLPARRWR